MTVSTVEPIETTTPSDSSVELKDGKAEAEKKKMEYLNTPDIAVTWRVVVAYLGILLGLFLAAIDNTIVATALPEITSEFKSADLYSWVIVAYLLTSTAFTPLTGSFSATFGKKNVFLFSIVLFLISSAICGASQNIYMLIIFRAIQGIGGGGILAGAMILISDWFPPQQRAKFAAFIGMTFSVANIAGPVVGGAFTLHVSWRWVFYINLPFGAASLVIVWFFLTYEAERNVGKEVQKKNTLKILKSIDYVGVILILAAVVCLVLGLSFGGNQYEWKSAPVIVLLVAFGPLVAVLIFYEIKIAQRPVLPMTIFAYKDVILTSITMFLLGAILTGLINYLPVYFQIVRGDSPIISGVKLIPIMVLSVPPTIISGRLISLNGYHWPWPIFGMALMAIAGGLLTLLQKDTHYGLIGFFLGIIGFGLGCCIQTLFLVSQFRVKREEIPITAAMLTFFRTLGGAVGVTVCQVIISNTLTSQLENPALIHVINQGYNTVKQLPEAVQDSIFSAYLKGMHSVFFFAMGLAIAAMITSALISPKRLPCIQTKAAESKDQPSEAGETMIAEV